MDRTNWKYGKRQIDILTIGIVARLDRDPYRLESSCPDHQEGNSNTKLRIVIFNRLLRLMKAKEILVLTMEREFGSAKEWLKYLDYKEVGYMVRIKANINIGTKLAHEHATTRKGKRVLKRLKVWTMDLFFANKIIRCKGCRDTHLDFLSNRFSEDEALDRYKLRWCLELLFSHLRKRGFNLDDTYMTDATNWKNSSRRYYRPSC